MFLGKVLYWLFAGMSIVFGGMVFFLYFWN